MDRIINKQDNLVSFIKYTILKYCPYTMDRMSLLGNSRSPELDIQIFINNSDARITFSYGNQNIKTSLQDSAAVSYTISPREISGIIDFILNDHEVINDMSLRGKELDLVFAINWLNESSRGINCGHIGLSLIFESMELEKRYLHLLWERYSNYLEQTPSFQLLKKEFINNMKQSYLDSLDKTELVKLLSKMSESELKELLFSLDNDTFLKHFMEDLEGPKREVLSLDKHNKSTQKH